MWKYYFAIFLLNEKRNTEITFVVEILHSYDIDGKEKYNDHIDIVCNLTVKYCIEKIFINNSTIFFKDCLRFEWSLIMYNNLLLHQLNVISK